MTEIIGYIGAFLTTISFLPQAIKTVTTRNTDGLSLFMYSLFVMGVWFWILYGILIKNPIIIISNCIVLLLAGTILMIKIKNNQQNKKG